ncbi:inactive caspase-12-like isoform 1-T1 [Trichechus inunguis]
MLDGLFDDLLEKNMLNGEELQRLREGMNLIMNRTENLVEDITGKTRKAGKIFMDCLFNPKKQLSLKSHLESDDDESEKNSELFSFPIGAEIDILGMQDLLENLGYLVVVKKNLFSSGNGNRAKAVCCPPRAQDFRQHVSGIYVTRHPGWNL